MNIKLTEYFPKILELAKEFVEERVAMAKDTSHGYKKNEAKLRADGAIRFVERLLSSECHTISRELHEEYNNEVVRLKRVVGSIPTEDQY
ncbi:hypothetical protein [Delftia tsuruhatensis]|uniref:hypothetical protein n=1 Tax=Delftia tsuruhatensis TaxID=180282 RepID=UPI003A8766A1